MKWNRTEKDGKDRKRKKERERKGKKGKNRKVLLIKGLGLQSRTFSSLVKLVIGPRQDRALWAWKMFRFCSLHYGKTFCSVYSADTQILSNMNWVIHKLCLQNLAIFDQVSIFVDTVFSLNDWNWHFPRGTSMNNIHLIFLGFLPPSQF